MSFPSCIKIPSSRNSVVVEASSHNNDSLTRESTISYDELISVANQVFGSSGWSHSVTSQTVDYVEYIMGKYHIGCAAFVRVQLADGTFHEDMGYSATESTAKASAIYSSRSASISLALKKALLCFGGEVEEKINEITLKTTRVLQESGKLREKRNNEVAEKKQKTTENCIKETKSTVTVCDGISSKIKQPAKPQQTVPTPKENKSSKPKEPEDGFVPIIGDIELLMDECQEPSKIIGTVDPSSNATHNDAPPTIMTEEEIRLERKRKQKQKQEEHKKLMREKQIKADDKPNPRF